MEKVQRIKVNIGDRVYPMTVHPDEEEGLRKAAKDINELILYYEQNFAVRDKQDVMAMCALHFASRTEQKSINNKRDGAIALERINHLIAQMDEALSESS